MCFGVSTAAVSTTPPQNQFDSRGPENVITPRSQSETTAISLHMSVIATAASYAICYVQAVASTVRSSRFSLGAAVSFPNRHRCS